MKRVFGYLLPAVILLGAASCAHRSETADIVKETYIHKYGVAVSKGDWNARGKDGEVITTLKNGVTVSKNYTAGQLNGITKYSFPHSQTTQKSETYEFGYLVKALENYASGLPKQETVYSTPANKSVTMWFETGTPQRVEEYLEDELISGKYFTLENKLETSVTEGDGTRTIRDPYGQLVETDTIKEGSTVMRLTYHSNGTPKEVIPYEGTEVHGVKKTFHPGGEPNTIENWVTGVQSGTMTTFHNGEKYSEVMFIDGDRHGVERRFRDGEVIEEEITWVKGRRHGPSYTYLGDSVRTFWYHQDERVSKNTYDKRNGVAR